MTAARSARVGDVIEHGQAIPANVVRFRDSQDDRWRRLGTPQPLFTHMPDDDYDPVTYAPEELQGRPRWWPMTVVEVDPEPQPAVRLALGPDAAEREADDYHLMKALGVDRLAEVMPAIERLVERERLAKAIREKAAEIGPLFAESGPLVLTLPEVPKDAVALVVQASDDGSDIRFVRTGGGWHRGPNDVHGVWSLTKILEMWSEARVEFAPPREPRTWPALETSISDLPDLVEVHGQGRWRRRAGSTLFQQGETWRSLAQLRELGEVREVLGDA